MAAGLPLPEGTENPGPLRSLSRLLVISQQSASGWAMQLPLPPMQLLEELHSLGVRMMAIGRKAIIRFRLPIASQPPTRHLPGPATLWRLERRSLPPRLFFIPLMAVIMTETMRRRGRDENEVMYAKHLAQGLVGKEQTLALLPSPPNIMACG